MEDSETKTAALEKVAELEDELGHVSWKNDRDHFMVMTIFNKTQL